MAHAIGCLGSSVETYRKERAAHKVRMSTPHARVRNQDRKKAIVFVSHDNGASFRAVKTRVGHVHDVKTAFCFADSFKMVKRA